MTMTGLRGRAAASWWIRVMSYRRKARQPERSAARPIATNAVASPGHGRFNRGVGFMTLLAMRPGPAPDNIGFHGPTGHPGAAGSGRGPGSDPRFGRGVTARLRKGRGRGQPPRAAAFRST